MNRSKKVTFYSAVLALIMLFAAGNSMSQTNIKLGFEAGLNIANVSVSTNVSTNSRTGMIFGGVADVGFTPQIGLVTGIRFVMKGYSVSQGNTSSTIKLNYLEFPALLKVKFPLTEIKPYVIGGPTLGINLSATAETISGTQTQTSDLSANTESIDFGLFFGAGMDFSVTPKMDLFFQGGYAFGMSNIAKGITTVTVKTNGIQLTGGVKFKI
jgi:hypothetical protein